MADKSVLKDQLFKGVLSVTRANHVLHAQLTVLLRPFELNVAGWLVLKCLQSTKETGMSATALSAATEMSLPQIAIISRRLTQLHYVRQRTQLHDHRSRHLITTERGSSQLNKINLELNRLEKAIRAQTTPNSLDSLNLIVDQLAHVVRES